MSNREEHPTVAWPRRQSARHNSKVSEARRFLAMAHREQTQHEAALEEALDELAPPYQRYRISRRAEVAGLSVLGMAEVVVAATVVQALGLTSVTTDLVAVGVGGAATGLAWLVGHEWAVSHDPQAVAVGRRSWLRPALATSGIFLAANLGVRVYYGVLANEADHLGSGLVTPLMSGFLLTMVTAALMLIAAFVSAHADTSRESMLRAKLRRVRAELRALERAGALRLGVNPRGGSPAADSDRRSVA